MKKNFGIMQGRLLPKYKGRYQAHPLGYWEKEFPIAAKLGLDSIEFILDFNNVEENPLLSKSGIEKIKSVEINSGVKVRSICADYFMEAPIHSNNNITVDKSLNILSRLIKYASMLNVKNIVIPCVDKSGLKNDKEINNFISRIKSIISIAEKKNINICVESDLPPAAFANLINLINSKNATINYDIGNSAALGYDPEEEFNAYGEKITDLHIKDRLYGKGPVPLGRGNADIPKIFKLLSKVNYKGIVIFQAFRDDDGIEIFKEQFEWFIKNIKL